MPSPIKVVLFDFMGTCLDWHSSIVKALPSEIPDAQKSTFALEYRQAYFDWNAERIREDKPVQDFDDTQRQVLDVFLEQNNQDIKHLFSDAVKERLIVAWHQQPAWPDVLPALRKLKNERGWEVYVHANGSTRLQLDLVKFAGLQYDMLFSSELLDVYKPAAESYHKVMKLLKVKPEECVMVAAHHYDCMGAKAVGMKTVYVYRWTDDIREDQNVVKRENDAYVYDMDKLDEVIAGL